MTMVKLDVAELERACDEAGARRAVQKGDVFIALDDVFEGFAADGDGRLARSAE